MFAHSSSLQEQLDREIELIGNCEALIQLMELIFETTPYFHEAAEACGTEYDLHKHHPRPSK